MDLDGPLRLAFDRAAGLRRDRGTIHPADPALWEGTWLIGKLPAASEVVLCYRKMMDRQDIIARLREHEATLRALGVAHAALFGSRARGDARPDSDIDIMIEIDPEARIGVWGYAGLKDTIASLFDGPVDVVDRDGLKPYVRPAATADAIYAF